jgi:hypothetical protein
MSCKRARKSSSSFVNVNEWT